MKGCFKNILTRLNFNKIDINFSWNNSKDNKLLPKINFNIRESSRQRIFNSLKKMKYKKSTINFDNNIYNIYIIIIPREIHSHINNTFYENKNEISAIKINEKVKNNILKRQIKQSHKKIIKIRHRVNLLQINYNSYINNTQNQNKTKIIQNNKIFMNINAFSPENIIKNKVINI